MSEFTEVTAENLRSIRTEKDMSQEDIASILDLQGYHISNIEKGRRLLTDTEKKILDWYFFGIVPPRLTTAAGLAGILDFDPAEWAIIGILSRRAGQTEAQWIASQIRAYLVYQSMGNVQLQSLSPASVPMMQSGRTA